MPFSHRAPFNDDLPIICNFPQDPEELFYMFPAADYPLTVDQLKLAVAQRKGSTLILWDEEPAGFANFHEWHENGPCYVGNVVIAPKFRGKKASVYLVNTMINLAKRKFEATEIRVFCHNENTKALLLYHKLNFSPYCLKQRQNHLGKRIAMIGLRLELE